MYTIYQTATEAIAANAAAAEAAGCNMISTIEAHVRIKHPANGQWALKDGTGPATHEQLEAAGWFAQPATE